ncbi:hypothetical protein SO694_00007358 [Aureococcus anophagefferens]|uniref:Uncharacterized protein n=1 Tax=Aureococcus anophagefferens TaxID=44056 RepID=A0ABR1GB94_AURAN
MAALKPHVDERRYEATLDAAAWADAAAALEDAALAKTLPAHRERGASPALLDAVAVAIRGRGASAVAAARAKREREDDARAAKLAEKASKKDATKATKDARGEGGGPGRGGPARGRGPPRGRQEGAEAAPAAGKRQRQAEKKRLAADAAGPRAPALRRRPPGGHQAQGPRRRAPPHGRPRRAGAGAPAPAPPPPGATVEGFLVAAGLSDVLWLAPLLQENEVDMATLALLDDADFEEMLVDAATLRPQKIAVGDPVVFDVKTNKKGRLNAVNVALDRRSQRVPRRAPRTSASAHCGSSARTTTRSGARGDAKKAAAASAQEKRLAAKQQRLEDVNRNFAEEAALELEKRALAREREQLRELKAAQAAKLDAKKAKAEKAAEKKREDRGDATATSLRRGAAPRGDAPARSYTAMRASYYGGDAPRAPSPFAEPFYGHGAPQANPYGDGGGGYDPDGAPRQQDWYSGAALPW